MSYTNNHRRSPAIYSSMGAVESSGWSTSGGVARPKNSSVSSVFADLQRQANRLAAIYGITRIGVDGVIGPATMSLVKAVGSRLFYTPAAAMSNVDDVAASADVTAAVYKARADNLGAPISAGTPTPGTATGGSTQISLPSNFPSSFPSSPANPNTGIVPPPSNGPGILPPMLTSGFPGGETGLLIAAGALGIMFFQSRQNKKRKGRNAMRKPWRGAKRRRGRR
jgi:hypothetical protein